MKKEYISPVSKMYAVTIKTNLLDGSGSVTTHNEVGSSQLSKGNSIWSFMDGDEEEQ